MKTPREIYAAYRIMPDLQFHQLRVAAVGKFICDNFKKPINTRNVALACLFHDMGNIIKSDLTQFPEFLKPQGKEYWEQVKVEYIQEYGKDEHAATNIIGKEIGLPESVLGIIDNMRFSRSEEILSSESYELKIAKYADLRAGPHGIIPIRERLDEAKRRYERSGSLGTLGANDSNDFDRFANASLEIERQIFSHAAIVPEDITDASAEPIIEELREYLIP